MKMRKGMTGAIVLGVLGDKDREKASALATHLTQVLDPATVKVTAPARMAELRVDGIDISITKEELRNALALAAGCGGAEVQVGEIGTSRGGLDSAWVRCPLAGARKLAQAGRIVLGWSTARVEAIAKRPLQCFKCLELGHVRATCVSTVDRSHICYRCGEAGHRARGCPASAPKCRLCELLGAPAAHRMGGEACCSPRRNKKRILPTTVEKSTADTPCAEGRTTKAVDGWEEAMDLVQ
jgi:hypothetical protein